MCGIQISKIGVILNEKGKEEVQLCGTFSPSP